MTDFRPDGPDVWWSTPDAPVADGLAPGGPPTPTPAPTPAPAPRHATAIAAFLVAAAAAFLVAGPLQHRNATTTPLFGSPTLSSSAVGTSGLSPKELSSVASKVSRGVVDINTVLGFQHGSAAGTGMVLTASGEILTNNHVVVGATKITATVVETGRTYTAKVVGTDPGDDVAVLQLEGASGLHTITTATAAVVAAGDAVVAVGNAGGKGGTPTAVGGVVLALGQSITATDENGANAERLTDLIEIDAPIESGDSGGPLANRSGDVIGMNSAADSNAARLRSATASGYAIPIGKALGIVRQIESGKATATVHIGLPAFLGVNIARVGSGRGAAVSGVLPGTPAESIGIKEGDTITSVNGQPVDSGSKLTAALAGSRPGDQVPVVWTDAGGTSHTARATLMTGPAD